MTRHVLTDEVFEAIPAWVEEGKKPVEIAQMIGCTPSTLQVQCCRRGISLRKGGRYARKVNLAFPTETLPLNEAVLKLLREAAKTMGKEPAQLASDLLEKIAFDNLYKAVLDNNELV